MTAVTVIGLDGRALTEESLSALSRADVVVGGRRHLGAVAHLLPPSARRVPLDDDLAETLRGLRGEHVVVLASGDPGFFGIVRALSEQGYDLRVIPAVSSVAASFARAGTTWDDALVVSAHGRDPRRAVNVCRRHPKVAVLTSPDFGPAQLGAALGRLDRRLIVAERLGDAGERVVTTTPAEAASGSWSDPNVVLVIDPSAPVAGKGWVWPRGPEAGAWALAEGAFEHRDAMVTKAEVRAVALAWLGPGVGDLVWDVGAGSGSLGVECARLGAAVIAVESDPQQCERVRANAARHAVPVEVIHGKAPDALSDLPQPDAVFVGGGGHLLPEIVRSSADRLPRSIVVSLATLERVPVVQAALADSGYAPHATLLQASRLAELGDGHRLTPLNPVFLVRGVQR